MGSWLRLTVLVAIVGCAHHGGSGDDDLTGATLTLDPPSVELVLTNGVAVRQAYTATLTLANGHTRDVTADTLFSIDSAYGQFAANSVTVGIGGKAQVFGSYLDKTGTADLIARVKTVRIDPSLPPNTPAVFDHPDTAGLAPVVVYPPAGVIIPRNLGDFEVHWTDAHSQDVFELTLHTEFSDVKVYAKGGNGLPAAGPHASWLAMQVNDWFTAIGAAASVSLQLRGATTATGVVGGAPAQTVTLSHEEMNGGLYYWATQQVATNAASGIYRHDMARPQEAAEAFISVPAGGTCVGCHVLSRDGTKMGLTYEGNDGPAKMIDVGPKTLTDSANKWNFGTFTPDAKQMLVVEDGTLSVLDVAGIGTAQPVATLDYPDWVAHPDLSPDGKQLVFATNPFANHDIDFPSGDIMIASYDQATHKFGAPRALVADGKSNFYPSWSPDGQWILFNKAPNNSTSYDNPAATTWVVRADGSKPAVQLATADRAAGLTNSWPRWAPFPQTLGTTSEQMWWVTFSSKRDFGVRLDNARRVYQRPSDGMPAKLAQIWMTPFFPGRADAGAEPSGPAFRLPFQDLVTSNHIPQWTEKVVVIQ